MSADVAGKSGAGAEIAGKSEAGASTPLRAVRADLSTHGEWEIELADQSQPVTRETLEDAQRVASCAPRTGALAS